MNRIINQEGKYQAEDSTHQNKGDETMLPVVEENVNVDKRVIDADTVRVSKKVNKEDVTIEVPTIDEKVTVERVPINQYVDTPPTVKQEGDVTIIPIMKEVLVVEKRLMLVEEIHVTKQRVETSVPQKETLRKEEVVVNRGRNRDNPNL